MAFDFFAIYRQEITVLLASKSTFVRLNLGEAILWATSGLACFVRALYLFVTDHPGYRPLVIAGVALIIFGLTDAVEASTGAWWSPWWLLFWKVVCLLVLICVLQSYFLRRRRRGRIGALPAGSN